MTNHLQLLCSVQSSRYGMRFRDTERWAFAITWSVAYGLTTHCWCENVCEIFAGYDLAKTLIKMGPFWVEKPWYTYFELKYLLCQWQWRISSEYPLSFWLYGMFDLNEKYQTKPFSVVDLSMEWGVCMKLGIMCAKLVYLCAYYIIIHLVTSTLGPAFINVFAQFWLI